MSTISSSASNINAMLNEPNTAIKNADSNKTVTIGPELQKGIQETQQELKKGSTENFKQELYKLNVFA